MGEEAGFPTRLPAFSLPGPSGGHATSPPYREQQQQYQEAGLDPVHQNFSQYSNSQYQATGYYGKETDFEHFEQCYCLCLVFRYG